MINVKMVKQCNQLQTGHSAFFKKKPIGKCVAVNPNNTGYIEAIIDDCAKIKKRLEHYKKNYGEANKGKKIYKLNFASKVED